MRRIYLDEDRYVVVGSDWTYRGYLQWVDRPRKGRKPAGAWQVFVAAANAHLYLDEVEDIDEATNLIGGGECRHKAREWLVTCSKCGNPTFVSAPVPQSQLGVIRCASCFQADRGGK